MTGPRFAATASVSSWPGSPAGRSAAPACAPIEEMTSLEKNCAKEKKGEPICIRDFRVGLTVLLKRIGRVVRYSIGIKFLERRKGKGQAHRWSGSRQSRCASDGDVES